MVVPPPGAKSSTTSDKTGPVTRSSPTIQVAVLRGETAAKRETRQKYAEGDLREGNKALDEGRFADAKRGLESALRVSGRQDFGNTPNEARDHLQQAIDALAREEAEKRHAQALSVLNEAKAIGTSNLPAAIGKLQDALRIDDTVGGADLLATWQGTAKKDGEEALTKARIYDQYNRPEAIGTYERAVTLLALVPGTHPGLVEARERLRILKGGR